MIYSCNYCGLQYTRPEGKLGCESKHRKVRAMLRMANGLRPTSIQYEDCPYLYDDDEEEELHSDNG